MIITLNEKEIKDMIITGLAEMGVPHDNAEITMIAGRGPAGMTAEIKIGAVTPSVTVRPLAPEVITSNNPEGAAAAAKEEEGSSKTDASKPLFGKAAEAK